MTWELHKHDARHVSDLLAPESVDVLVTSPPYYQLRSYRDEGEHFAEQVGSEQTPAEFLDTLIECTADWLKVLKPTGSMWINLGDKMSTGGETGDLVLRDDLTDEERAYVFAELAACNLL